MCLEVKISKLAQIPTIKYQLYDYIVLLYVPGSATSRPTFEMVQLHN